MADPRPKYCPTESERLHRQAMKLGSAALLNRLQQRHPSIVMRLQQRAQERSV